MNFCIVRLHFTCNLLSIHLYFKKLNVGRRQVKLGVIRPLLYLGVALSIVILARTTVDTAKKKIIHAKGTATAYVTTDTDTAELYSSVLLAFSLVTLWFFIKSREDACITNLDPNRGADKLLNKCVFALQSYITRWLSKIEDDNSLHESLHNVSPKIERYHSAYDIMIKQNIAKDSREPIRRIEEELKQSIKKTSQEFRDVEESLKVSLAESERQIASLVAASEKRLKASLVESEKRIALMLAASKS